MNTNQNSTDDFQSATVSMLTDLIFHRLDPDNARLLRHLRAQERRRVDAPVLPSLRNAPQPREINEPWVLVPRTPTDRLRIGSRLADLEPTIDNSFVFLADSHGRRTILRRQPGIKGWLRRHCPTVGYSSAMKYKKLATRLRSVCGLPPLVPLEWLLPDSTDDLSAQAPALRAAVAQGRRKLAALLKEFPTLERLTAAVDQRLKIVHFPSKRQVKILVESRVKKATGRGRKSWKKSGGTEGRPEGWHLKWRGYYAEAVAAAQKSLDRLQRLSHPTGYECALVASLSRVLARRKGGGGSNAGPALPH